MWFVLTLTAFVAFSLPAQAAQHRPYAGRIVAEVLQELQTPELKIIFSTDLVKPSMRVQAEPKSTDSKDIVREILEPHGLTARPGPGGTLLVIALPRKDPPTSRRKAPAAPAGTPQPSAKAESPEKPLRMEEQVDVIERSDEANRTPSTYALPSTAVRETAGALENVFLTLQLMPGVVATNDEDGKMSVRGAGPEHNLILLDGVPIHNPLRLGDLGSPSFLNPATASSITLDASGLDARHGGRLSSVTVLETRDGNRARRFGVSGSVGLTTGDVLAEGRLPGTHSGSWWATARGTYYRAVLDRFGEGAVPGFADVQGKVTLQPSPLTRLSIFAMAGRETLTSYGGDDAGVLRPMDEVKGINRLALMNFTWNPSRRLVTTTTPSIYMHSERQGYNEGIPGLDAFERVMHVNDFALRQRLLYAFSPRHVLEGGVELRRIDTGWRMKSVHEQFTRGLGPTTLGEQIDYSAGPIDTSLTRTQAGTWLQDRIPLGSRVTLDPGVRLDWNSYTGEAAWQPRMRVTARAGKATIWAGIATQVQTPSHEGLQGRDYFHLTPADGSHLRNERSRQAVIGVESPLPAGLDLRVEAYHRRFDRLLVQRLETEEQQAARLRNYVIPPDIPPDDVILERRPTIYPESTGRGIAKGVEMLLQRRAGRATGWMSYTYSRSTRDLYGFTIPFDYDRPHALKAVGTFALTRRLRLSGTWQQASGLPATPMHAEVGFSRIIGLDGTVDPFYRASRNRDGSLQMWPGFFTRRLGARNAARLNPYSRTDLRLTYSTLGHWEFYGEVINVFNQRNYLQRLKLEGNGLLGGPFDHSQNVYPQLERLPTFGVRVRF